MDTPAGPLFHFCPQTSLTLGTGLVCERERVQGGGIFMRISLAFAEDVFRLARTAACSCVFQCPFKMSVLRVCCTG